MYDPIAFGVWAVVMVCWFVFAGVFVFRKKPPPTEERKREPIFITGIALQSLSYGLAWTFNRPYGTPLVIMPLNLEIALAVLTVAIGAASAWIVMMAVRMLGKQWSLAARITKDHQLITVGPYNIMRHPIYTGMLGLLLATMLAVTQLPMFLPALVLFLAGTFVRIRSEERLLQETFGDEFEAYKQRVPALIPWIY